ncbi:unnamed protein product [Urochloa humidicola]
MSPTEGSDGEKEVFINEEDIIHEITIDDEELPDRDDDDETAETGWVMQKMTMILHTSFKATKMKSSLLRAVLQMHHLWLLEAKMIEDFCGGLDQQRVLWS